MDRAAAVLSGFGVVPGGRVGLFAHPGLDYVVALLGAWRLGATAVLVDLADKDRFGDLMVAASPDAVVYTNDHFEYVRPALEVLGSGSNPTVFAGMDGPQDGTVGWLDALAATDPADPASAGDELAESVPAQSEPAESVPVQSELADGTSAIAMTAPADPSSTRTHDKLLAAATDVANRLDLGPEDSTLCPTPLAQPFHLEASILPALLAGATAGLLKTWQPEGAWDAMERNGTTVLCGTAGHVADLMTVSAVRGRKPSALRAAVVTSADSAPAGTPASAVGEFVERVLYI